MSSCYFCNEKIDEIPYRCTYCGMLFCNIHRLPENHKCPFALKLLSDFEDRANRSQVIYQDALDFMDKELTVVKIYEYVTTRQMDDMESIELLTFFLEEFF